MPVPRPHPADDHALASAKKHPVGPHSRLMRLAEETPFAARCRLATAEHAQSDWVQAEREMDHDVAAATSPGCLAARSNWGASRSPDWHPVCRRFCCPCRIQVSISISLYLSPSLCDLTCARLGVSRCLLRGTAAGHRRDSSRVHRIRRSWRLCRPAAAPRRRGCQLAPVDEGRADEWEMFAKH